MATNEERIRRGISDHVQGMVLHGVSGSEAESSKGNYSERVVSARSVALANANVQDCRRTGRHSDESRICENCAEAFGKVLEVNEISAPEGYVELVHGTGTDDQKTGTLPSGNWWDPQPGVLPEK